MNILTFLVEFGTEQKCRAHFKLQREQSGIICKNCKGNEHYWLTGKEQWQCKKCKFRTTLKSGSIMHESKMSFLDWYQVMAFMSFSKKGISAKEVVRQLGKNRYESVWSMMHKIRSAMGTRDARYQLTDMVEMDEGYFKAEVAEKDKKATTKRGKGSTNVTNTMVMAESTPVEDIETGKTSTHVRYIKMKALDNQKAAAVLQMVESEVAQKTIMFSDKSTTYTDIDKVVEGHMVYKSSKETTTTTLRWVHIAISNARRVFDGIYHHMKLKYLQNYLNEFCYKTNRRYFGAKLFDRVAIALAQNLR
jgi:ISXO2-like transposase domain/Transposase zinc-ribbon domain